MFPSSHQAPGTAHVPWVQTSDGGTPGSHWDFTGVKLFHNSDKKDVHQRPREGEYNAAGTVLKSRLGGGKSHISLANHEVETGTTNATQL